MRVHKAYSTSTAITTLHLSLACKIINMEGNVQHAVKHVSKFDGKNVDDFLESPSKLRASLLLYSKPIFEIVQGSQRPSDLDND